MKTLLDNNDQPQNALFNLTRRIDRGISEMLGLVKGILFDGIIVDEECKAIHNWIESNQDICTEWPGNIILNRLENIFSDDKISDEERNDLKKLLIKISGGKYGIIGTKNLSTNLPLNDPQPPILFWGNIFVLTGGFAFGPRNVCEKWIINSGGLCENAVTKKTNYLIIGTFASRDWIQTSFGRKIEKAIEYRNQYSKIAIISEDHWAISLPKLEQ